MVRTDGASSGRRVEQRAFTRERILNCSRELFAAKGYLDTTVDDIAVEVGCSRATFYLHFRAQREVVVELGARMAPEVESLYTDLDCVLADDDRDALRAWMRRAFAWMAVNHAILRAMEIEKITGWVAMATTLRYADQMPNFLARWSEEQRPRARIKIGLLAAQFAALYTYFQPEVRLNSGIQDEDLLETMTDLWDAALQPPGPPEN